MNHQTVRFALGRILIVIGLLMIPSIVVALIYGEGWAGVWPFLLSLACCVVPGWLLSAKKPTRTDFYMKEGFVVVALSWILLSLLGGLPMLFSGSLPSLADTFFETASGFTTTGASVAREIESWSHSQLFWRSFTHLIGGMGVLVFALAIMPKVDSDDVFIMRAEMPGPIFGKLRSKVRGTARVLYIIYLGMTAVLIVILILVDVPVFDLFLHAFGAAGTGGFGIKNNSVAFYANPAMEYVLSIAMILFGVNFNLYYFLLIGHVKSFFKSEELHWYLGIIATGVLAIVINTMHLYDSFATQIRDVLFTVSSIITTTGFTTVNYDRWPMFSHIVLLLLMFVGGMAGSTAGGLKVSRVAVYIKSTFQEIKRNLSPNRKNPVRFEGEKLSNDYVSQIGHYLMVYIGVFIFFFIIISFDTLDFKSAFSGVAATFNNIGPGLDAVGPSANYATLSVLSKVSLSFGMIMGRLEIFPILVLFAPSTWRKI
ncbi:MAG: TrkH family potassium uptake protein [Fastidiosipilaceae bacterium]|jgi:trk system potassium uptake protein TrkH